MRRRASRRRSPRGDPSGTRGAELGGLVAGRGGRDDRRPGGGPSPLPKAGRRRGGRRMATGWHSISSTSRARGGGKRLAGARAPLARSTRGRTRAWLASFLEGYIAHIAATASRAAAGPQGGRSGGRSGFPTSRSSGWPSRAPPWWRARRSRRACAASTRPPAAALEGEAAVPISNAWACCFLVRACTAVLDFERASEWCDRIAEFAKRYGSRYMLAFCRVEYGAVHRWHGQLERPTVLQDSMADSTGRGRQGWAGRWSGWPS